MTKNRENDVAQNFDVFNNFEKFFDLSQDLFCIAGYDGYFKRINPSVSKLLEYSNEELLARPINDFVYKTDKEKTSLARNELKNKIPLFSFENRYLTKSGHIVWLLWTSIPVEEEKLIYAVAKNITHKKELELERTLHLKKLTEINNEFKQLSYSTAHDLRSPVNNMLAIFELMDIENIQSKETIEFINILKNTTDTLKENLNQYIRVLNTKNQNDYQLEEIDLNNSLNEVLTSINSLIQNSKATINIDFSKTNKVNFNKAYLKSIFLNLITNAIKYSKSDILPNISILSEKRGNTTQLIIKDNGIGFDLDKVKDKVFGLHQTFNEHIDSNGIGLYLVYNYITNLGGRISLESEANKGAKFTITFND
ncbi:PAS domain-containing sensor histidine kinase [Flavobacterium undicola]|uniref:PAS domain-containing sensor histidine kinase n=1 Tax=Flavobacterium undicola TaxID=1932779 RepID=UPI0013765BE9|nr:PAS domain-containing sensor histidine kinase [Flavobacterium undicola]MBA0885240.1 PAS domain-containing sensor histidine kinase [Flavobacterium undicola]